MENCDIKPTDGATIFAYLRTRKTSRIVKLGKKDEKWNLIGFEHGSAQWEFRMLTTTPKGTVVYALNFDQIQFTINKEKNLVPSERSEITN